MSRVLVTGASGLLGRALMLEFNDRGYCVFGVAKERTSSTVESLDLLDANVACDFIGRLRPDLIVHSAALRFPDIVDANKESARRFNVDVSENLALQASKLGAQFVYISTDYVFDGEKPPFSVDDQPNPLNYYGQTKLEGERRVLAVYPRALVLRVPVLYGPVEYLGESAVTSLFERLRNSGNAAFHVNASEIRYPAHVADISAICRQLVEAQRGSVQVSGVFQWSGREALSKHQMTLCMARACDLKWDHVVPSTTSGGDVKRPRDTQMDTSRLDRLGIGAGRSFDTGIKQCLAPWLNG